MQPTNPINIQGGNTSYSNHYPQEQLNLNNVGTGTNNLSRDSPIPSPSNSSVTTVIIDRGPHRNG